MLRTRATRRCSTAPADALQTAAVTCADRRSPITTPAAPHALRHPADRAEVVRILDLVEHEDEGVVSLQQGGWVAVAVGGDLGAYPLVLGAAADRLDLQAGGQGRFRGYPGLACSGASRPYAPHVARSPHRLADRVAPVDDHRRAHEPRAGGRVAHLVAERASSSRFRSASSKSRSPRAASRSPSRRSASGSETASRCRAGSRVQGCGASPAAARRRRRARPRRGGGSPQQPIRTAGRVRPAC